MSWEALVWWISVLSLHVCRQVAGRVQASLEGQKLMGEGVLPEKVLE